MFEYVRSHTRLFLGAVLLLIIPSFIFFGVQGYSSLTDESQADVAQVAGQGIKRTELEAMAGRWLRRAHRAAVPASPPTN